MSKKISVRLSDENYDKMSKRAIKNNSTMAREINKALSSSEILNVTDEELVELRSALILIAAELTVLNTNVRKRGMNINSVAEKLRSDTRFLEQYDNAVVLTNNITSYAKQDEVLHMQIQALAEQVETLWESLK
ncbi:hypothetical protein D932_02079 [Enterococcus casseliflavus 14-MB-W-14]|uniref:hypothetical protein n=1 Tax=Enterococcus casseliflavus TaxID=37734 RepID=UPI000352D7C4|nr:hypothetical protein [Enterococcus casseliflavus]EPH63162.1 hypothetical protein D932_02079 [Enterococcus casseliflavus 14-MB-W-14]NKD39798.1 hypothetical protein [Enterococcus casseliflavus]